jgi:hypothetical protein
MKQVEKIWSEMTSRKEDLASQEVKLSLIGDLNKLAQDAKDLQGQLERGEQEMKDAYDAVLYVGQQYGAELEYAEKLDNDLERAIVDAARAADALGMGSVPEIDEANERRDNLRKAFNDAYQAYKRLDI